MKKKVYIETTVISLLTARLSSDIRVAGQQLWTQRFWELRQKFDGFYSDTVKTEVAKGDAQAAQLRLAALDNLHYLEMTQEAIAVASRLIHLKLIPKRYLDDALHIATAAVSDMDLIVTWNFKHISNPMTKGKIVETLIASGHKGILIGSPEEFIEGGVL